MNLERVGHLLGFELRRIKWLIAAAAVFLAMAFMPRLSDALGRWDRAWVDQEEFLTTVGGVGFGFTGLFLAIWSGLVGRKLLPARPVRKSEIRVVSLGVLLGVLVIPVLVLTLASLWLYGFSGEVILRNVRGIALAVLPMWLAVRLFAKYAGSLKVVAVGLGVVGALMVLGTSFEFKGLAEPWANVLGSWPGDRTWVASLVAWLVMGALWFLAKRRGVVLRMTVAVLSVAVGWGAMLWLNAWKKEAAFGQEFAGKIEFTGKAEGWWMGMKARLTYEQSGELENEWVVWEVDGALTDERGRPYANADDGSHGTAVREVGGTAKNFIAESLLKEGDRYFYDGREKTVVDLATSRQLWVTLPEDFAAGDEVRLSGRLLGKRYRVDPLVKDVPFGESTEFRRGDLVGTLGRDAQEYPWKTPPLELVVRAPLLDQRFDENWTNSEVQNWIVHLRYPKSKMVFQGRLKAAGREREVGGVKKWIKEISIPNVGRLPKENDDIPLLSIYRVIVEDGGFVEIGSGKPISIEMAAKSKFSWTVQTRSRYERGPPMRDHWKNRPDPEVASREKVGGWLRELEGKYRYRGRPRDLAQYADRWGDLFLAEARGDGQFRMRPFVDGASDEWRDEAIAGLGRENSIPWVLVSRAWHDKAEDQVRNLITEGTRDPEILRLGILLGLEGLESAVLEALLVSDRWDLYEAARLRLKMGEKIEGILDQRLERVEEVTRRLWVMDQKDYEFTSTPWLWLLHEGRRKDLERCLAWMKKAHECGNHGFFEDNYRERSRFETLLLNYKDFKKLGEAGKLRAELFRWDPVWRRWIFDEKENVE